MTDPWLDPDALERLLDLRGGCSCHIRPPCFNCTEPITFAEMIELGILEDEFDEAAVEVPVDHMKITRDMCR